MKKIIAFVLALVMVLVCAVAFASEPNMTIDYSDPAEFLNDPETYGEASSASQETALWLQVAADGQINCTIPLVLVYKTNIDGGTAITDPAKYMITNNSTADIVVTSVEVDDKNTGDDPTMTLKDQILSTDRNFYTAKLTIDKSKVYYKNATTGKFETAKSDRVLNLANVRDNVAPDSTNASITADQGGVFYITKAGGVTGLKVEISTSPLTFTTKKDDTETPMNRYGVNLLNIIYTVGIDTHSAYDGVITGTVDATQYGEGTNTPITYTYKGTTLYDGDREP